MVAHLLRTSEKATLISLLEVSQANKDLVNNPAIKYFTPNRRGILSLMWLCFRTARMVRDNKTDAMVCWMYHAMAIGVLVKLLSASKVPLVWNVRQSLDDISVLTLSSRLAIRVCGWLSFYPSGIVFNSERALRLHTERGFRKSRASVIPNGFILPATTSHRTCVQIVGFAGRYHPQKDFETFMRAAAQLLPSRPHIRFVCVGKGISRENPTIAKLVEELRIPNGSVDLRGEVQNMSEFYNEIDVLVLSSRTEGFPNVVGEAMSFGKPVVTTNVGDAAKVVGSTGVVVSSRNPRDLCEGMKQMVDLSPKEYARRCKAARHRIETEFELSQIVARYRRYFTSPTGKV